MRWRWAGWAGVELATDEATVVIDPLGDAGAVFAAFRDVDAQVPSVVPPTPRAAVAGLISHLHRDHADAAALDAALAPGAPILEPPASTGEGLEVLGLAQAEAELAATGRERRRTAPWTHAEIGPFTLTAVPAVDGTGDPQVSWVVEADGQRVLHLGDTMPHGGFWPIALRHGPFDAVFLPVNGAVVRFPHRRPASPLPIVMDPRAAAVAAELVAARRAIPIHAEGYEVDGIYAPVAGATDVFLRAAAERGMTAAAPELGSWQELAAVAA